MNGDMSSTDNRFITFYLSGCYYAIPIAAVREVTSAQRIHVLPGARKPLEGLMIYRGVQVLPVFSLTEALDLESMDSGDLIVVVELKTQILGFRVQKIGRVVDGFDKEQDGLEGGGTVVDPDAVLGIWSDKGASVVALRLEKVFRNVLD